MALPAWEGVSTRVPVQRPWTPTVAALVLFDWTPLAGWMLKYAATEPAFVVTEGCKLALLIQA